MCIRDSVVVDFVEICNVCTTKVIIKDTKRIFNSDKICGSYCDFYFGVTFFGTHCTYIGAVTDKDALPSQRLL